EDLSSLFLNMRRPITTSSFPPTITAAAAQGFVDHGTAAIGVLVAGSNGYGVTGIAYGAQVGFVSPMDLNWGVSVADAINEASPYLTDGDVILLEQQARGPFVAGACSCSCPPPPPPGTPPPPPGEYPFVPVEYNQAEFDAISNVIARRGVVVVEAACNGGQNLDDISR